MVDEEGLSITTSKQLSITGALVTFSAPNKADGTLRACRPTKNQNELARAIHKDPSKIAKTSVEDTIQKKSITDLPEYTTAAIHTSIANDTLNSIVTYEINKHEPYKNFKRCLDSFDAIHDGKEKEDETARIQP